MTKKIIVILIITVTLDAGVIDFYKKAVSSLQYNSEYILNKKANELSQKGVYQSKYANFTLSAEYSKTNAQRLRNSFDTTDVSLNDKLDVFGKNSYKIDALRLDLQSQKSLLNIQKEQLFISLVNMIAIYNKTSEQLSLYKTVLNEQENIYKKLKKLQAKGAITSIDLLRFKNQLTSLQMRIINQKNEIVKMKKELHLYVPNQTIPILKSSKILYLEKEFLSRNPQLHSNTTEAQKLLAEAKGLDNSYLPDITAGAAYQQIGDPTSYGDNYSLRVGLQIPINSGNLRETQALQVKALSLQSKNSVYEMQRKDEYIRRYQEYIKATQELKILDENLDDYKKSEKTIKTAYLRQYIDFNTYTQVILQTLHVKEQMIAIQYTQKLEATILNGIASGAIYE